MGESLIFETRLLKDTVEGAGSQDWPPVSRSYFANNRERWVAGSHGASFIPLSQRRLNTSRQFPGFNCDARSIDRQKLSVTHE